MRALIWPFPHQKQQNTSGADLRHQLSNHRNPVPDQNTAQQTRHEVRPAEQIPTANGLKSTSGQASSSKNQLEQHDGRQTRVVVSPPSLRQGPKDNLMGTGSDNNSKDTSLQPRRPPYTFAQLAAMAMLRQTPQSLTFGQICDWVAVTFPYYDRSRRGQQMSWEKSIASALSASRASRKRAAFTSTGDRMGLMWSVIPDAMAQVFALNQGHRNLKADELTVEWAESIGMLQRMGITLDQDAVTRSQASRQLVASEETEAATPQTSDLEDKTSIDADFPHLDLDHGT